MKEETTSISNISSSFFLYNKVVSHLSPIVLFIFLGNPKIIFFIS